MSEIVEHIPDMIFVKDARDGTFVLVNRAAENLLGFSRHEMLGKTDFDFFPHREAEFFRAKDQEVINGGQKVDIPQEPIHTRQGLRWLHTQKIPIPGRDGTPRYLAGISHDITEVVQAREQIARLASQLQQAQEEERQRLARELHDELGQVLTGVRIELAWMLQKSDGMGEFARHLEATERLVDSALSTVRRVATALRPQILDDLGLKAGIDWLLQEICGRAGLETRLDYGVDGPVNSELSITVYRACQEALTNVIRHAQANQVGVTISSCEGWLETRICDDGIGLQHPREGSLGLLGIRERVQLHRGEMQVEQGQGGTCITFRLPLQAVGSSPPTNSSDTI